MSLGSTLASRVANLFSSESTTKQQNHNGIGLVDDGISGGKGSFADVRLGTADFRSDTMAPKAIEEEEEEGRPPYIHVSRS
jgi:hypothetical protein